jgi:hypothetical protein
MLEHQNREGMLMAKDFEKAFDSISWDFLYDILKCSNFGAILMKWIKILNNYIYSPMIQNVFFQNL